jgi:hypothetical protein
MSSIVLYHSGKGSVDPKTNQFYDPWRNHIWDTIEQIRLWNPLIPCYFIVDEDKNEIPDSFKFEKYTIEYIHSDSLPLTKEVKEMNWYFADSSNPLWERAFIRFFYIESLIKDKRLESVFTFDNDVLVYCDLNLIGEKCKSLYQSAAITRADKREMVCGMMWIKDVNAIQSINKEMIDIVKIKENNRLTEMILLHKVWENKGNSVLADFPIWFMGDYSDNNTELGGIFDPCTISQYMDGTHNGSPPGTIITHHELAPRIATRLYKIVYENDFVGRKFFSVLNTKTQTKHKINSLHMHSKRMKEFMSNA